MQKLICSSLFLVLGLQVEPANAVPIFDVSVNVGATAVFASSPDNGFLRESDDEPVSLFKEAQVQVDHFGNGLISSSASALAFAAPGVLRTFAHGRVDDGTFPGSSTTSLAFPWGGSATGAARFRLDDLIISGLADALFVEVSLNLALGGAQSAFASTDDPRFIERQGTGSSRVEINGNLAGTAFTGRRDLRFANTLATTESGILAGFTGDDALTTPTATVRVGSPFALNLQLITGASGLTGINHISARGDTLFDQSLTFPTFGSVFNLPAGYTINSASGLIVDNEWVGTPVSVPEPSTLALLVFGAVVLAGYARGRSRNRAA